MAPSIEAPYFCPTTFDVAYLEAQQDPSPYSSSTVSERTLLGDHNTSLSSNNSSRSREASPRPAKRLKSTSRASNLSGASRVPIEKGLMAVPDPDGVTTNGDGAATAARPKRVRTGCLTCRERHLKCDEGVPHCQNCRKSSRVCKRGVRLNFIDTQVQDPPIIPPTHDWSVNFQDESREIASEYKGGLGRYAALEPEELADIKDETHFDPPPSIVGAPTMAHQQLPPIQALPPGGVEAYSDASQGMPDHTRESHHQHSHSHSNSDSTYSTMPPPPQSSYSNPEQTLTPPNETRDLLTSQEEVLFMQVFVEEVGLWMDSMDPHKHVCPTILLSCAPS